MLRFWEKSKKDWRKTDTKEMLVSNKYWVENVSESTDLVIHNWNVRDLLVCRTEES